MLVGLRAMTETVRLGRYEVVKRLASGGMADVLLGRTVGIEGFERHVVIKRIHAKQARDTRYVTMFLDEARLAASLHHANIVQVNDIGQEDGEYFFAMEYVLGEDVRKILGRAAESHKRIPLEHTLSIITGAAAGLHHAHEQIRVDGTSLGIVHRDVSPANILVGLDGGVKLVDFGIAKAAHQSAETQDGVLKGKIAYMSPEQCNNEDVDRRSDVFSLGIVLYELLTVRPLFQRENDFLAMSAIVHEDVAPPSTLDPQIPPELDAIVVKALARDPAKRFQTADEMRRVLEKFAETAGIRTSTTALADYMKATFGERRDAWLVHDDDDDDCEVIVEREPELARGSVKLEEKIAAPVVAPRRRRSIVIGALALVVVAVSLIAITQRGSDRPPVAEAVPVSVPNATPAAPVVAPPPAIPEVVEPPVAPAVVVEPAPAKKSPARKKPKPATAKSDKHWDPKALFPE